MSADLSPGLSGLPVAFSAKQAQSVGLGKHAVAGLVAGGEIERIAHGLYVLAEALVDVDLVEACLRRDKATLCLDTALARHGLIDQIPMQVDVALPSNQRVPATQRPIRWHKFSPATFEVGRDHEVEIGEGLRIAMYNAPRSIIDAYRLRHIFGIDTAEEALKSFLDQPGNRPSQIVALMGSFPTSDPELSRALRLLW